MTKGTKATIVIFGAPAFLLLPLFLIEPFGVRWMIVTIACYLTMTAIAFFVATVRRWI